MVPGRGRLGWRVHALDPHRALVFCDEREAWCWTLALEQIDRYATRLISRQHRLKGGPGKRLLFAFAFDPAHCVMDTGALKGIKKRVEHAGAVA